MSELPEPASGPPAPRWRALSPRARFRARIDRDPRRWVLLIVALGSMAGPMLALSLDHDPAKFGVQHLLFALFLPLWGVAGILGMLLHGRLGVLIWATGVLPTRSEALPWLGAVALLLGLVGAGALIDRWRARR